MCFDTSGTIRFDTNSLEIERIRVKIRSNLLKHTHTYIYMYTLSFFIRDTARRGYEYTMFPRDRTFEGEFDYRIGT